MSEPKPSSVATEYRRGLGEAWLSLRAFMADRRRILSDPHCMLSPDAGLAFPPLRFAAMLSVVVPTALLGAVLLVATTLVPPPAPVSQRRVEVMIELREALRATFGEPGDEPAARDARGDPLLARFAVPHLRLTFGPYADRIESARLQYLQGMQDLAALPRNGTVRSAIATLDRRLERSLRNARFHARLEASGWYDPLIVAADGMLLLFSGTLFRWLIRRQGARYPHADAADRVMLYYATARLFWLSVFLIVIGVGREVATNYQVAGARDMNSWIVIGVVLVLVVQTYRQCAPTMARVLTGIDDPEPVVVRDVARRIVASWCLTVLGLVTLIVLLYYLMGAIGARLG